MKLCHFLGEALCLCIPMTHCYMCNALDVIWRTVQVENSDFLRECEGFSQRLRAQQRALLTLGAHAQRGLRYLVCVCVCVFVCVSTTICDLRSTNWKIKDTIALSVKIASKLKSDFSYKCLNRKLRHLYSPRRIRHFISRFVYSLLHLLTSAYANGPRVL